MNKARTDAENKRYYEAQLLAKKLKDQANKRMQETLEGLSDNESSEKQSTVSRKKTQTRESIKIKISESPDLGIA